MEGLWAFEVGPRVLHEHFGWLIEIFDWVSGIIELAAILVLVVGGIRFIATWVPSEFRDTPDLRQTDLARARIKLGAYILSGLELFIVSDIIHTALSLAFADLLFLGLLVVIRSIVSFFLEREIKDLKEELGE